MKIVNNIRYFLCLFFFFPGYAIASKGLFEDKIIDSPEGVRQLIVYAITLITTLTGTIAIIVLVVSGIKFMAAGGNEDKISSAKAGLTAAVIGILLVIFARIIIHVFVNVIGGEEPIPASLD